MFKIINSGYFKSRWLWVGGLLLTALSLNLALSSQVYAFTNTPISNIAPLPGSVETDNGLLIQPYLIVDDDAFDGKFTYLKVYVPVSAASATVTVINGRGTCPTLDSGDPEVDYSLFELTDTEFYPTSGSPLVDQANSQRFAACGDIVLNIDNISRGIPSIVAGHEAYKVYYFEAAHALPSTAAGKFFRVRVDTNPAAPGGLVGYSRPVIDYGGGGNSFFGIRLMSSTERAAMPSPQVMSWDFQLQFGARCDDPSPDDAIIDTYDADVALFSPQSMSATLDNYLKSTPPPPAWVPQESWTENELGTPNVNHDSKQLTFNADNLHGYRFTWLGSHWNNTLQMRMPYDQFDAQQEVQCPPPGDWIYVPSIASGSGATVSPGDTVDIAAGTANEGNSTGPEYTQTVQLFSGSVTGPNSYTVTYPGLSSQEFRQEQNLSFTIGLSTAVGSQVCFITETRPHAGTVSGGVFTVSPGGVFETTEPLCFTVVEKPYLKVYGNDIWSGGNYDLSDGNPCTVPSSPSATGNIQSVSGSVFGAAGTFVGAVAQYAAFAYGDINAFGTAEIPATDSGYFRLAFANTNSTSNLGHFGEVRCLYGIFDADSGGLGGQIDDLLWSNSDDETGALPDPVNAHSALNNSSVNGSGQFTFNGDVTLPNPITVTKKVTILVNGNVTINNDIMNGPDFGSSADPDIPIAVIVATGDIIIDSGVERLDGIFISLKNIHTCSMQNGPGGSFLSINGSCNNPLEVNGSFIANNIPFRRTGGGLNGSRTEHPVHTARCNYFPDAPGMAPPSNLDVRCSAEVFRFGPDIYLADPIFKRGAEVEMPIQQIRDLPPVF